MRNAMGVGVLLVALLAPAGLHGQRAQRTECRPASGATRAAGAPGPSQRAQAYDVVVDVPNLCVERISLDVNRLDARLALNARVANLVRLQAGADVSIGQVNLEIRGVRAQALLLVDLDNVVYVVDRALAFVDANPQVVSQLVGTVQNTVGTVGGVANTALQPGGVASQAVGAVGRTLDNATQPGGLLSQTVNTLGQTVQRTVDASGGIVERTLDASGQALGTRGAGSLLDLPVVRQATNAAGQTVRQVRDTSGAIVELTLDQAGRVVGSRVLQPAGGRQ
jgi:hypothetical protein